VVEGESGRERNLQREGMEGMRAIAIDDELELHRKLRTLRAIAG